MSRRDESLDRIESGLEERLSRLRAVRSKWPDVSFRQLWDDGPDVFVAASVDATLLHVVHGQEIYAYVTFDHEGEPICVYRDVARHCVAHTYRVIDLLRARKPDAYADLLEIIAKENKQ